MVAEGAIRERRPREYAPYVAATSGDDRGKPGLRLTARPGFCAIRWLASAGSRLSV